MHACLLKFEKKTESLIVEFVCVFFFVLIYMIPHGIEDEVLAPGFPIFKRILIYI